MICQKESGIGENARRGIETKLKAYASAVDPIVTRADGTTTCAKEVWGQAAIGNRDAENDVTRCLVNQSDILGFTGNVEISSDANLTSEKVVHPGSSAPKVTANAGFKEIMKLA